MQDVPRVTLQAHRYRCSTSTVVSNRGVVIYSSLTGSGLRLLLGILNVITKSRLSFLILIMAQKMPNLSLMPLKPSCHPQHDMRDTVLKDAIALRNE